MLGLVTDNVTVTAWAFAARSMVAELMCHPDAHVIIEIPTHESALVMAQKRGRRHPAKGSCDSGVD